MTGRQSKTKSGKQRLSEMEARTQAVAEMEAEKPEGLQSGRALRCEKGGLAGIPDTWQDTPAIPVQFLFFKEPQRLPGSQSASSLTSYTDAKTSSRHTIDWLPSENQFRIVYHPANHPTETRYIFSSSISNYARFDPGETYGLPHGSALRPKE